TQPLTDGLKLKNNKVKSATLDLLETLILALVLFFGINYVTQRVRVENISMLPTLKANYLLVVNKLAYRNNNYSRGDIIVFHYQGNKNSGQDYIKRVIGIPGDHVVVSNGAVKVNGIILEEPYIMEEPRYVNTWDVPEGKLFVLGDNRNDSSDSSSWGFVDMKWVVGQALMIYWPLDQFRLLAIPDLLTSSEQ
ncbi:MAG TPA: signal peptidase I, partial [Anaerolineaceae bacterium]|nr:signal peptidase I [Anaerolineaceae bacterium]